MCTLIGWGATNLVSDELQKVKVPVIADSECKQYFGKEIFSSMMCAGYQEGDSDVCQELSFSLTKFNF